MLRPIRKIRQYRWSRVQEAKRREVKTFIDAYVRQYALDTVISEADKRSQATGSHVVDYVVLHSFIMRRRPGYVLELGTGKSTWIIADALSRVHALDPLRPPGLVVSMEEDRRWFEHAVSILPQRYRDVVKIQHSPLNMYSYSFVRGTCYNEVPSYPFELVYVDGPNTYVDGQAEPVDATREEPTAGQEIHVVANMDFVRVVSTSDRPVTAIVDFRTRTLMAYACIFGKQKVRYLDSWGGLGVVEDACRDDLVLNGKWADYRGRFIDLVQQTDDAPSWLRG